MLIVFVVLIGIAIFRVRPMDDMADYVLEGGGRWAPLLGVAESGLWEVMKANPGGLWGIQLATPGFLLAMPLAVVVTLLTPPPSQQLAGLFDQVNGPADYQPIRSQDRKGSNPVILQCLGNTGRIVVSCRKPVALR